MTNIYKQIKRAIGTVTLLQVIFLYGLLLDLDSQLFFPHSYFVSQKKDQHQPAELSLSPCSEECQTESITSGQANIPFPSEKDDPGHNSFFSHATGLLFLNLSSIYILYSKTIPLHFPKTDITFPFRYFW